MRAILDDSASVTLPNGFKFDVPLWAINLGAIVFAAIIAAIVIRVAVRLANQVKAPTDPP